MWTCNHSLLSLGGGGCLFLALTSIVGRVITTPLVNHSDTGEETPCRLAPTIRTHSGRAVAVFLQQLEYGAALLAHIAIKRHTTPFSLLGDYHNFTLIEEQDLFYPVLSPTKPFIGSYKQYSLYGQFFKAGEPSWKQPCGGKWRRDNDRQSQQRS